MVAVRQPREVLERWVDLIQTEGRGLTDWEKQFIANVAGQLHYEGGISERQEEILEGLYAEKTP